MVLAPLTLTVCVFGLLALGMTMLYSASNAQFGARLLLTQLGWCGLGVCVAGVIACVDYRRLKRVAWLLLVVAVVLLALVLVPGIGVKRGGARRWFDLGFASFQPSEFAKVALICFLAWYGERFQRYLPEFRRGLLVPGLVTGAVLGLIFVEPDRGTTILLAAVSAVLLLVAGTRWLYVLAPGVMGVAALALAIWLDPLRRARVLAFLYPELYKDGAGYQAWQAMLALGAGHWTGVGLGHGRQKLGFIPEHHTDFILAVIGEEWGLAATGGIVLAFALVLWCGTSIARNARDTFGMLLAAGVTFLISFQAMINIGVVTSSLPNKGLPLPFVSYGGSNLLVMLAGVGLLLSIARVSAQQRIERTAASDQDVVVEPQFS
jgi:cell division protein FtsW